MSKNVALNCTKKTPEGLGAPRQRPEAFQVWGSSQESALKAIVGLLFPYEALHLGFSLASFDREILPISEKATQTGMGAEPGYAS